MGRGYLLFSPELLKQALHLPDETQIYGADWDFDRNAVKIYIASPDLPKHPEGASILQIDYEIKSIWQIDGYSS